MTQNPWFAFALLSISWMPNSAKAFYGVDMNLACHAIRSCDVEGICKPVDQSVDLSIVHLPVTDDSRFWPVRLTVNGNARDAEMITDSGPIFWGEMRATGNFLTPLLKAESPMGLIWQRNDLEAGTTDILFLSCNEKVE